MATPRGAKSADGEPSRAPERAEPDASASRRERGPIPEEMDALDPSRRLAAQLAPPVAVAVAVAPSATATGAEAATRARSVEELVPELVRRIAWAGDARRGSVRLELGAGAFAGASVVVHADDGRVRVELGGLPESVLAPLRARLDARLRRRGIALDGIT